MLGFLADLPSWAPYAIVSAVLGISFGVLGYFLERLTGLKPARYAAIIGIVLAKPVVDRVLTPIIFNHKLNADLPKMIDEAIRADRIEYEGRN